MALIIRVLSIKRHYEEEELAWWLSVTDIPHLPLRPWKKEPTYKKKKKKWEKKYYNVHECIYFFLNNILTQTTHHMRSGLGGLNVEARFFYHTGPSPKLQTLLWGPKAHKAQWSMTAKKTWGNGIGPSIRPKTQASPLNPKYMSAAMVRGPLE